jgi:regulatory protein
MRSGAQRSPDSGQDAFERAAVRYLAGRDRTEAQMTAYLTRAGASPGRIRTLLDHFRARGYLNDRAYALRWAQARLRRRPMGAARLEAELEARGFARATVAEAVAQAYEGRAPREWAARLLRQRERAGTRLTAARKAGLLRQYGFEEDVIGELIGTDGES